MGQMIPLAIMAAAAGAQAHQTKKTADRQDAQAAEGIRQQGRHQREADAKVNAEVDKLAASTAADARAQRLDDYMDVLRQGRGGMEAGLTPAIGSSAFRADSAEAADDVMNYAGQTAGLMSRIDAPGMQRQGEAFGFGNLATDIGLIGRQSAGDQFINDLRMRSIRRNPWVDAAATVARGYAGSMTGGGPSTLYTGQSGLTYVVPTTRSGAGWHNAYGAGGP